MNRLACINPIVLLWAVAVPDPSSAPDCGDDGTHCWETTPEGCRFFSGAAIDFELDEVTLTGFECVDGHLHGRGSIATDDMLIETEHGTMVAGRREGEWDSEARDDDGALVQYGTERYENGLRNGTFVATTATYEHGTQTVSGFFSAGVPTGTWFVADGALGDNAPYRMYSMGATTLRIAEQDPETGKWRETGTTSKTTDGNLIDGSGCLAQGP